MEIPYTVTARPDTGLWNAKIGIWLFLASEVMLFGGLFSSYIFLRLDADFPWPVHVLTVMWGCINTLVLIFSSVTVLQAWLALKMRNYGKFQIWMSLTILCALGFMCIKSIEYYDKFHHYGVQLQDGSVLEGHYPKEHPHYEVKFGNISKITLAGATAEQGTFRLPTVADMQDRANPDKKYDKIKANSLDGLTIGGQGSDPGFLRYVSEGAVNVECNGTGTILDTAKVKQLVKEAQEKLVLNPIKERLNSSIELKVTTPFKMTFSPGAVRSYDDKQIIFKDGTVVEGKLEDDKMHLEADKVDVRRLIEADEANVDKAIAAVQNADVWRVLGGDWKAKFDKHNHELLEEFHRKHEQQDPMKNTDFVREAFTMELNLHESGETHVATAATEAHKAEKAEPAETTDHTESGAVKHHHPEVVLEKKDIHFYSNFTPKYNNYFAIYFTLTGLHGLHVIGGALVLTYMLLFGKKLYKENPEHMANRVETVGLFWHFVDLVWIFLFPLLYLM